MGPSEAVKRALAVMAPPEASGAGRGVADGAEATSAATAADVSIVDGAIAAASNKMAELEAENARLRELVTASLAGGGGGRMLSIFDDTEASPSVSSSSNNTGSGGVSASEHAALAERHRALLADKLYVLVMATSLALALATKGMARP